MRWIRQTRLWLVLGLLLLIVSLVGARYINGSHPNRGPDNTTPQNPPNPKRTTGGVVASGQVDTAKGMLPLVPRQPGEVLEVYVEDGQTVKKGQPLIRIDSRLATNKLKQAETGVNVAKVKIDQAKQAMSLWENEVAAQKKIIAGKEAALKGLKESYEFMKERPTIYGQTPQFKGMPAEIEAKTNELDAEKIKLTAIENKQPVLEQKLAQEGLANAEQQLEQARLGVEACTLSAPADGTVVRVSTKVGETFGPQINVPAMWFRPKGEMIVRVDLDQEWADRVKVGQKAVIYNAANPMNKTWTGTVTYVADVFLQPRELNNIPNPFGPKQENVLECRVTLDPGQETLPFIGQKVRVHIGGN